MVVRDEGMGFTGTELPDPTAPEQLRSTHGRGICLMKVLMDEVQFERGGTTVCMRKKSAKTNQLGRKL